MGLKIHEYPLEAFQINDEDFYDVDYWNGSAFESRKISGATLKAELLDGTNIYNSDGTLTGVRVLTLDGNSLTFDDTTKSVFPVNCIFPVVSSKVKELPSNVRTRTPVNVPSEL